MREPFLLALERQADASRYTCCRQRSLPLTILPRTEGGDSRDSR